MKKNSILFMYLFIVLGTLWSASYAEGSSQDIGDSKPLFTVNVDLSGLNVEKIGFSGTPMNHFNDVPTSIQNTELSYVDKTKRFEAPQFYVYWKLVSSSTSFPDVYLSMKGPLIGKSINDKIDWTVTWKYSDEGTSVKESTLSSADGVKVRVFPKPASNPGDGGKAQQDESKVLKKEFGSIIITAAVDATEYWLYPSGLYTSDLLLTISSK